MRIVCAGAKPNLRLASCCDVEVVNGGGGLRLAGLASIDATVKAALSSARLKASASAPEPMSSRWIFLPSAPTRRASNVSSLGVAKRRDERPIFPGDEFFDFQLAVADEA